MHVGLSDRHVLVGDSFECFLGHYCSRVGSLRMDEPLGSQTELQCLLEVQWVLIGC